MITIRDEVRPLVQSKQINSQVSSIAFVSLVQYLNPVLPLLHLT